jgi:putative ABC transport system permease protein
MRPDVLLLDIRYTLRRLRQNPVFTVVSCLSLAVGIGANTAAFSVLHAVLLRELPVRDAASLALVSTKYGGTQYSMSYPAYRYLRDNAGSIDGVVAFHAMEMNLTVAGNTDRVTAVFVSGNYFQLLGVDAAAGSLIQPQDDEIPGAGGPRGLVAVLSHQYWTQRLGRDPGVIGSAVQVNGTVFTVTGVAPAAFRGLRTGTLPDVFVPLAFAPKAFSFPNRLANPRDNWLRLIARLERGVTIGQAQAEMTSVFRLYNRDVYAPVAISDASRRRALEAILILEPGRTGLLEMDNTVRPTLYALMALVTLVLLIAAVNVASLMVGRAERSHRATAITLALGASRSRVWAAHFIESAFIAVAGVVAGLLISVGIRQLLTQLVPANQKLDVTMDGRVLAVCIATVLIITISLAALTARHSVRLGVSRALKGEDLAARLWLRKGLIAGQLALSVVVLVAAVLFGQTLRNLRTVDPGFDVERILIASIATDGYTAERLKVFRSALLDDVRRLPGVLAAALAGNAPLDVNTGWNIVLPDATAPPRQAGASIAFISADYFKTMGIPLLRGRDFVERDRGQTPRPIVVNENFVRAYVRQADPIGAEVRGNGNMPLEIIGVVKNSASTGLRDLDQHMIYVMDGGDVLHVRAAVPPATLAAGVEAAVRRLDPAVPIHDVRTVAEQVDHSIARERTFAALSSTFGLMALLLSAIGVYGIMANAVSRRTKELGIRLALGARPGAIVQLMLGEAGMLVAISVAAALPCAWVIARSIRSLLFGVGSAPWIPVAGAIAVLAAVAVLSACIPARRAGRVDPLIALRAE